MLKKLKYNLFVINTKIKESWSILNDRNPKFLYDKKINENDSKNYAIVVKYSKIGITKDFLYLLSTLKSKNINTIVVCNGPIDKKYIGEISPFCHRILVRKNIGRDFGAYRSATLKLVSEKIEINRILYFNDSVYFLSNGSFPAVIDQMLVSNYDAVGTFENHETTYHMCSFAFCLSSAVFYNKKIIRFWKRYKPYSIRPHAISKGELRLSKKIVSQGYKIDIVFSSAKLSRLLHDLSIAEIFDILRFAPIGPLRQYDFKIEDSKLRIAYDIVFDHLKEYPFYNMPNNTRYLQGMGILSSTDDSLTSKELAARKIYLIDLLMSSFINASQVHYGFGYFYRLMNSPLIKKDLVQRGIFYDHDIDYILSNLGEQERTAIVRELTMRGRPLRLRGREKFLRNNGLV